jgi:hypothetical protein
MSTKIYTGYRFDGNPLTLPSLTRAAVEPVFHDMYLTRFTLLSALFAQRALTPDVAPSEVFSGDLLGYQPDLPDTNAVTPFDVKWQVHQFLNEKHHEVLKTRRRNPAWDLEFEIGVVGHPEVEGALVVVYTEHQRKYLPAWEAVDGVRPWPYWDNTDQPDDVTDAEWDERGRIWGEAIGWEPLSHRGLTWSLIGSRIDPLLLGSISKADVAARWPDAVNQTVLDWLYPDAEQSPEF